MPRRAWVVLRKLALWHVTRAAGPIASMACNGVEQVEPAAIVSEGADRISLANTQLVLAEGQAEAQAWVGPPEQRLADLLGFTVYAKAASGRVLSVGITDAAGKVLTDPSAPEFSLNRSLTGVGTVVAQLPVASDALPLVPPYTVRVLRSQTGLPGDLPEEKITIRVWAKFQRVAGTIPKAQELQVQWIRAGGTATEQQLDLALQHARNIWRHAGLELVASPGTTLDNNVQPKFAHVTVDPALGSDSPDLKALLLLSQLAIGEGVPLFLVNDISLLPSGALWAITGGIPVPPTDSTERSGLAVSASLLKRDPKLAGQIIAHELGHAMGLFHSTEGPVFAPAGQAPRAINDGIADTPACPATADKDKDGVLSSAECHGFDAGNLMFWGTPTGAVAISAQQAEIVRRSLLTR